MANLRNQPRAGINRRNATPRRRSAQHRLRLVKRLVQFVGLMAFTGLCWTAWQRMPVQEWRTLFPLNHVRIVGDIENLDVDKLQNALLPAINGGYFSQDLGEVERAIRSFAWVDRLTLVRVWPDTLEIDLDEQKAVARWGDHALLNARGERFTPEEVEAFAYLPVIYGPVGMEAYLLEMLTTLNDRLGPKGVNVASLDMSKRRAWIVKLSNGLEIHFGRQDPVKLLERFLSLVPKLGDEVFAQLKRVDLRYTNGFAVVWKSAEELNSENGTVSQLNGNASNLAEEN